MSDTGQQLDGQTLFERQQAKLSGGIQPGPVIVTCGLEMAENAGAVLRLADAAGAREVIFLRDRGYSLKNIRRASRNAHNLVKWKVLATEEFLLNEIDQLPALFAIELTSASRGLFETRFPENCTILVGSERYGIPTEILARCQAAVHIPMYGVNGSMNVTHALAIALFEWRRQMERK